MAKLWRKIKWLVFFLGHGVYGLCLITVISVLVKVNFYVI